MKTNNPYYNPKIQKILNQLISEEWIAGQMYKFYVYAMEDQEDIDFCQDTFNEISEDELNDHMESMISWARTYGYSIPCKE